MTDNISLAELTTEIVSAYVGSSSVAAGDIAALVRSVHGALISVGDPVEPVSTQQHATKAQIRNSIGPDFLTSFEDGGHYKSLKRHLTTRGMTPDEYRNKWGLPKDYPMVSQSYSTQRSELAKKLGLGNKRSPEAAPPSASPALTNGVRKEKPAARASSPASPKGARKPSRRQSG